jgi:hypothetical protein
VKFKPKSPLDLERPQIQVTTRSPLSNIFSTVQINISDRSHKAIITQVMSNTSLLHPMVSFFAVISLLMGLHNYYFYTSLEMSMHDILFMIARLNVFLMYHQ